MIYISDDVQKETWTTGFSAIMLIVSHVTNRL